MKNSILLFAIIFFTNDIKAQEPMPTNGQLCDVSGGNFLINTGECMGSYRAMKYFALRAGIDGYCATAIEDKLKASKKLDAFFSSEYANCECYVMGDPLGGWLEVMVDASMMGLALNLSQTFSYVDFNKYLSKITGLTILEYIENEKTLALEDSDEEWLNTCECFKMIFSREGFNADGSFKVEFLSICDFTL